SIAFRSCSIAMVAPCQALVGPGRRAGSASRGTRHTPNVARVNARYSNFTLLASMPRNPVETPAMPWSPPPAWTGAGAGALTVPPVNPLGAPPVGGLAENDAE